MFNKVFNFILVLKDVIIKDNQKVSLEAAILERRRNSPLSEKIISDNL